MKNDSVKVFWTENDSIIVWCYYMIMSLPWFLGLLFGGANPSSADRLAELGSFLPISFWILGLVPVAFVCWLLYNRLKQSGCTLMELLDIPSKENWFVIIQKGVLIGFALFLIGVFIIKFWSQFLYTLGVEAKPQFLVEVLNSGLIPLWQIVGLGVLLSIAAPFTEEICFRAIIFERLKANRRKWVAVLLSSSFFAVVHLNLFALPGVFFVGLGLAVLYDMQLGSSTGYNGRQARVGLLGSMVAHLTFNVLSFLHNING